MNQEIVAPKKLAACKEQRSLLAVKHGLPPLGARMVNQFGIEWVVDGHTYMPDLTSLARDKGQVVPEHPRDLLPIIVPQNLSPRLLNFIQEVDLCTSRVQVMFDTMPHLRPQQAHAHGHSVEMFADPQTICFFLDAAHLPETILAHEVAHVWIDLVEDCEDDRIMRDLSDTTKVRQVLFVQSFVLDRKVNQVVARKGFDMNVVARDRWAGLSGLTHLVAQGERASTPREAVFWALTIADTLCGQKELAAVPDLEEKPLLNKLDAALEMLCQRVPLVYALAEACATAVRQHGIDSRKQLRASIDECLRLTFDFTGEAFDVEAELHEVPPIEPDFDKWLEYFPGWPPKAKKEVGRLMARNDIPPGTPLRLQVLPSGQRSALTR